MIIMMVKKHYLQCEIVDLMLAMLIHLLMLLLPNRMEVMLHSMFQLYDHLFQVEYQVHMQSKEIKQNEF
jgi:hypothetical protein